MNQRQIVSLSLLITWISTIFYLSGKTGDILIPEWGLFQIRLDAFIKHVCEFGLLGLLLSWTILEWKNPLSARRNWTYASVIGSLYGVLDEIHQYYVPGRYLALRDIVANIVGVVLGAVLLLLIHKLKK